MSRALCAAAAVFACGAPAGAESGRPSVLIITLDTVRADHLSTYGYRRETSPRLTELARHGVCFESAISPIPQTGPAHASLLTGRWPASLQLHANGQPLDQGPRTLPEVLAGNGYDTAAFVSGFPLVAGLCGLARGFASYDDQMPDPRGPTPAVQRRGSKTTDAALRWLGGRRTARPFFLWVHYYDPHGDYSPGGPYDQMFMDGSKGPFLDPRAVPAYQRPGAIVDAAEFIARYDGELRYVDDQIARLLDGLASLGLLRGTVVVVVGDHGENLVEHGSYFDHGNDIYMEAVHVPLVLAGPGVPSDGRRIRGIAPLVDVMPTLLGLLHIPVPVEAEGASLVRSLAASSVTPAREVVSEARLVPAVRMTPISDVTPKISVRDGRFTFLWRLARGTSELYDRSNDPGELHDLFSAGPEDPEGEYLRTALLGRLAERLGPNVPMGNPNAVVFEPKLRARLVKWLGERPRQADASSPAVTGR